MFVRFYDSLSKIYAPFYKISAVSFYLQPGAYMTSTPSYHIVILCSRLDLPGGIEKAIIQLANLLDREGHKITLLILDETDKVFFPLNEEIETVREPLFFGITSKGNKLTRKAAFVKNTLQLRKLLKSLDPEVVIATEYPFAIAAVLSGIRKKAKLITWEHHHLYELPKSFFWEKMFRLTYPRSSAVVTLNSDEKKLFDEFNDNTVVIPNFITPSIKQSTQTNKKILTVGRLTHVKGTDLLLEAAKIVFQKHPDWQWELIGTGDMKAQLLASIKDEKLESHLLVSPPLSPALETNYAEASIYVCSSRHESFGMTIIEAMNAGLPCISFDCETGPRHIIRNNEDGLLVEKDDPAKLAVAISSLITNEEKRKKMGEKALENVKRFSPGMALPMWKELIGEPAQTKII